MFSTPKKSSARKTSGAMTRELFRRLGFKIQNVEMHAFNGSKKDFLDFIDDIAFCDGEMIGLQSCLDCDLQKHRKKFAELVKSQSLICEWMIKNELWLIWWTPNGDKWTPQIEVLTTHKKPIDSRVKLFIVK